MDPAAYSDAPKYEESSLLQFIWFKYHVAFTPSAISQFYFSRVSPLKRAYLDCPVFFYGIQTIETSFQNISITFS